MQPQADAVAAATGIGITPTAFMTGATLFMRFSANGVNCATYALRTDLIVIGLQ